MERVKKKIEEKSTIFFLLAMVNGIFFSPLMIALFCQTRTNPLSLGCIFPSNEHFQLIYSIKGKKKEEQIKNLSSNILTPFLAFLQQYTGCGFLLNTSSIFRPIKKLLTFWHLKEIGWKTLARMFSQQSLSFFFFFFLFHYFFWNKLAVLPSFLISSAVFYGTPGNF